MKKTLAAFLVLLCSCAPRIGNITDYCGADTSVSHNGLERYSRLEAVHDFNQTIGQDVLQTSKTAVYPRIKKLADGTYMMLCQDGRIGSRIFRYSSLDLMEWTPCGELFSPAPVETPLGPDRRCWSTADAVVLGTGEIIVACSYRASAGYKHNLDCGIMVRRSLDNGKTWTKEEKIFEGTNWEPYLLELPDGRVQCYFTDCHPATRNSGTSVIVSDDKGVTWKDYRRVCRQFKYVDNGTDIFTDQMPCVKVLPDGRTLFGFMEARLEPEGPQGKSIFKMSLVYNDGFEWKDLGEHSAGPQRRQSNVVGGCAGYVSVFPSGEVLVSTNISQVFSIKVGDSSATEFNGRSWQEDWYQPFTGKGFWGTLEVIDPHRVVGAMHCDKGIQMGVFYLNHAVGAPEGDFSNDALFIGSDSKVSTMFRFSHRAGNLEVLVECVDEGICPSIELLFGTEKGILPVRLADMKVTGDGCRGRVSTAKTRDGRNGFKARIKVPVQGDTVMFNALVEAGGIKDTFTFADPSDTSTWIPVLLQ